MVPDTKCPGRGLIPQQFGEQPHAFLNTVEVVVCQGISAFRCNRLDVGWDMIKDIQKRHLEKRFSHPKLKHLKRLAIDEISIGAGHRYLTIVLDLKSGAVVFVGDGKGADALSPFWCRLKQSGAAIEAVAIDMSRAYIQAVRENLPDTVIVFDHFHVIKLFNEKLSDFRRKLFDTAHEIMKKSCYRG